MTISEYSMIASALNLAFLIMSLGVLVNAFSSSLYGGYIFSDSLRIRLRHTKWQSKTIILLWLCASILVFFGYSPIFGSFVCLVITYYFFIYLRYDSVSRGFGAPGYFITFANLSSVSLQLVQEYQPKNLDLIASLIGFEIGTIMLVSGIYKCSAGYLDGRGINVGLNNPMWAYRPRYWKSWAPNKKRTKLINWVSILGEIFGGLLLMSFKFQLAGALVISLMFVGVMFKVRLGSLCPTIIFVTLGTALVSSEIEKSSKSLINPNFFAVVAVSVQVLILLVYLGISFNFYRMKSLPSFLQKPLNTIVSFFGISLWRVFTSDMTSIFVRIYCIDSIGKRKELSEWSARRNRRFNFVGEAIAVTSIFTFLKYQSSFEAFEKRLICYAKTLPGNLFEFEFHYVETGEVSASTRHVRTYSVNTPLAKVTELIVDSSFNPSAAEIHSRVSAKKRYGSYN